MSMNLNDASFFCSWSGGKDSCLTLYYAVQAGGQPNALLTMFRDDGQRSRSHGLPVSVIQAQADSMGIPLIMRSASWQDYETEYISALHQFKKDHLNHGVFGDIDIDSNRAWHDRVCDLTGVHGHHPLWKKPRRDLLTGFLAAGFKATIVSVNQNAMNTGFLGRVLDKDLIAEIEATGVDASGEEGEYHTIVTDGPLFSRPLAILSKEKVLKDGYWFLDVSLK